MRINDALERGDLRIEWRVLGHKSQLKGAEI